MSRRNLSGARVLVTGASGGLGRALALELGRQGASIVLMARREDRLRDVAKEVEALGGRAHVTIGDVTDVDARRAALEAAQSAFDGLDILINNAGAGAVGPFASAGAQRMQDVLAVNYFAPAELTREALPLLRAGREPLIVNVGSILGHAAMPRYSEYCASKFALRGLSDSLRAELSKEGIGVLHVSLGPTETEFFDHLLERNSDAPWRSRGRRRPSAEYAARKIVRAMAAGRSEVYPTWTARLFVYFNRLFPGLLARILRRYA